MSPQTFAARSEDCWLGCWPAMANAFVRANPSHGCARTQMFSEAGAPAMPVGTSVEVFIGFSASWVSGFEIAGNLDAGYQLCRLSDGSVLPKTFPAGDLRIKHTQSR